MPGVNSELPEQQVFNQYLYMRRLLLFILPVLVIVFNDVKSQDVPTQVSGKMDKTYGRYLITLGKSVNGFFCAENIDLTDSIILQNEKFDVNSNIPLHSFVRLNFAHHQLMLFYADSAEPIRFELLTDSAQNPGRIFFFGANAAANELLANHLLLSANGKTQKEIEKIIIEAPSAVACLNSLHSVLNKFERILDELFDNQKISGSCHEAFIAETEQRFLLCCKDILRHSTLGSQAFTMSKKEMNILINHLYTQYDPFDKRYFTAPTLISNITAKCILINDGIIPPVIANPKDTWKSFAGVFTFIVPYIGVYDLAPNSIQHYLVGNALLANLLFNEMTKDEFIEVYTTFRKRYPASPYIKIIDTRIPRTRFLEHSLKVPIIFTK